MRFQANLPNNFWGECVLVAAHLINRTPTPIIQNKTPFENLFHKPPLFDAIRNFSCLCFAHNQKIHGDKFASKSRKCVFVGYPFGQKGWRLYDLDAKVFFVSRDVKFLEDVFPFHGPEDVNIAPHIGTNNAEVHDDFADCGLNDIVYNEESELGEQGVCMMPKMRVPMANRSQHLVPCPSLLRWPLPHPLAIQRLLGQLPSPLRWPLPHPLEIQRLLGLLPRPRLLQRR